MEKWSTLHEFMQAHKVESGFEFTHTSLGQIPFTFYVPFDDMNLFYKLYEKAITAGDLLHITEKNRHVGPIVIDMDFKLSEEKAKSLTEDGRRVYNKSLIKKIVQAYSNVCKTSFDLDGTENIYVMEKASKVNCTKDGLHIVIPKIATRASVKHMIRKEVIEILKDSIAELNCTNSIEDIIDDSVIEKNNWYMYGSGKLGSSPYNVTTIYNIENGTKESLEEFYDGLTNLAEYFSIRNKYKETELLPEVIEAVQENEKIEEDLKKKSLLKKKIIGSSNANRPKKTCNNIEMVKQLVEILNPTRANSYDSWIRLGWCLHNIDEELDAVWETFSLNSAKYKRGECSKIWNQMKEGGLGIGSLHMWAKEDNPCKYAEIMKNDLRTFLYESLSGSHHDIARVVYNIYQHTFVCSSFKYKNWYEFKNHSWHSSDSGIGLRSCLSEQVYRVYKIEAIENEQKALTCTNESDRKNFEDKAKIFRDLGSKLRNTAFKENVMKECSELFYVSKFEENLDSNPNLIGFENGVYDLEEHLFRDGRPEDNISFTTGVSYTPYDKSHPINEHINNYMAQVLPNKSVRYYVLKLFASFLSGYIKEQKFYIWTGSGSNSKSKLVELFEKSMGDYCCKFPITMLTQKRVASNAANSELARAKGKRFGCLQEPSEDEKINIGLMKELSGGDKIMARALYKEPFEFNPQFKMLLLCNHLPQVPSDDGGTWRRIRVVEFTSKFVENPKADNEYPIDYDLSAKMEGWTENFISMLIHYYKKYEREGMSEPAEVLKCTTDYKHQNDHMSFFVNAKFEKFSGGFVLLGDAHSELRAWIKEDCIPIKPPSKGELEKYIAKNLGVKPTTVNGQVGFNGYRIRCSFATNEEEDD
jgi:P4 family phage/plasmid primase-like protien